MNKLLLSFTNYTVYKVHWIISPLTIWFMNQGILPIFRDAGVFKGINHFPFQIF